jgi:hypothetical protein
VLSWKLAEQTATYNPAAHTVAASDSDKPKCYKQYWMIKGVIRLVHDLGLSKYRSAPLHQNTTANLMEKNRATVRKTQTHRSCFTHLHIFCCAGPLPLSETSDLFLESTATRR